MKTRAPNNTKTAAALFRWIVFAALVSVLGSSCGRFRETLYAFSRSPSGAFEVLIYKACWPPDCGVRIVLKRGDRSILIYDLRKDHMPGAAHVTWLDSHVVIGLCNRLESTPTIVVYDLAHEHSISGAKYILDAFDADIRRAYKVSSPDRGPAMEWLCGPDGSRVFIRNYDATDRAIDLAP